MTDTYMEAPFARCMEAGLSRICGKWTPAFQTIILLKFGMGALLELADAFLPRFEFSERHEGVVAASPSRILAVIPTLAATDDPIVRALLAIRQAPARLMGGIPAAPFGMNRFTLLAQNESEMVFGLCGRFWRADFGLFPIPDGAAFKAFHEAGVPKLLMGFATSPTDEGATRLVTETRIHCLDAQAKRAFAPYWFAIRAGSGLIRRRMLSTLARRAKAS
jgi:hypothetical protein